MSEQCEIFKVLHEYQQRERRNRKEESIRILEEKNIWFTSKNDGNHLIIRGKTTRYDFWPSTGLFINFANKSRGRGLENLLKKDLLKRR